jgi:hypothetical protein
MGGIYLCYSAFYVSVSVENIRNVVLVCLDLLYTFLFVCLVRFSLCTKYQLDKMADTYERENAE